ncbi:MAG: SPOR domain-containing protein [Bacteroidales bacterium]|nr:SPOR domain-containing protein [Bacteroidales bacterium]
MNEIALHIDFLLHTHDCIIVPGLGGFVVNETGVEKNGLWGLDAPAFELIFNSKLTYNDGLLAESLMKTNNISFTRATKLIESASQELRNRLIKSEEVEWDNLGIFKTNKENNIIFLPNKAYVRPQFFGLSNARFKPAALALTSSSSNENAIPVKSIMRYVSTAIAVAVLFFLVVVSYNNTSPVSQHAEIVSKPLIFGNNPSRMHTAKASQPAAFASTNNSPSAEANNTVTPAQSSTKKYYIVVGVYEVRDVAEKSLSRLKKQGFVNASMIERPTRLDVYSDSFSSREEAQTYLLKFHADNASYRDAWILKR